MYIYLYIYIVYKCISWRLFTCSQRSGLCVFVWFVLRPMTRLIFEQAQEEKEFGLTIQQWICRWCSMILVVFPQKSMQIRKLCSKGPCSPLFFPMMCPPSSKYLTGPTWKGGSCIKDLELQTCTYMCTTTFSYRFSASRAFFRQRRVFFRNVHFFVFERFTLPRAILLIKLWPSC